MTTTTPLPDTTDVLIVGAGPTGLALAMALQKAGVDHLLVDKLTGFENSSRAAVIHAHTLEEMAGLDVAGRLRDQGHFIHRFAVRDRDRAVMRLAFDRLPSRYAGLLMLPQDQTERTLADRHAALGGRLHRGATVAALRQDDKGVTAEVRVGSHEQPIRARYVVGGDGMHSVVRAAAGIGFSGFTYEETFVLADVEMDWPLGDGEVAMFFSPAGLMIVAPLPGRQYRIVALDDDPPSEPSLAYMQAILDARGPAKAAGRLRRIVWGSRFRVHHRLADRYRDGRLFVMGDAAHVHSPAGGQGMNTGIVDALVLGRLLAGVIKGARPEADLALFGGLRRPAARKVLALSRRLTRVATLRSRPLRLLRNLALRFLNLLPFVKRRMVLDFAGLTRRRYARLPG